MPELKLTVDISKSTRVSQIEGLFDVPACEKAETVIKYDKLPTLDEDWKIGLIVGASGSGKTSIARETYGDFLYTGAEWPENACVMDGFPQEMKIKEITALMTAVGFSSPPSWIKPYHVLSNGEKFRCDLARGLASVDDGRPLVVFDEFTSVVDRNVAKVASFAVSKAVRNGKVKGRFIAVSCHYDIAEWLEPDWVLDMSTGELSRRRLRRPSIRLEIFKTTSAAWPMFKKHHYLSGNASSCCHFYIGMVNGEPATICVIIHNYGKGRKKGDWRISRIVVLPDYQGIGLCAAMVNGVADILKETIGLNSLSIVGRNPAMIASFKRNPKWFCREIQVNQETTYKNQKSKYKKPGFIKASFRYKG